MSTASVCTPIKSHHGLFSTKTAGGRMPLTPSPRARNSLPGNLSKDDASPFTPPRQTSDGARSTSQSVYGGGNLASHFAKSVTKTRPVSKGSYRESPKSNIARVRQEPRHLEPAVSDWTLTGTGPAQSQTPTKKRASKKETTTTRTRTSKSSKTTIRLPHTVADRFIPNRTTSEGLITAGSAKSDETTQRPKTSGSEG
ncbi:hypothetical protein FQN49_008762, partial [Arthroderma sp. PD_2]